MHFLEKLGILPEKLFNNILSHYVPRTKLSSISKRTSEKGYDSRAILSDHSFLRSLSRENWKQEKARARYSCICISTRRFFLFLFFPLFGQGRGIFYVKHTMQFLKEIGLQRKDANTSNYLKMVAIHWFIQLDWIFVSPLHMYFRVSTWELSNKYVIDSENSLKRVRELDDRTSKLFCSVLSSTQTTNGLHSLFPLKKPTSLGICSSFGWWWPSRP